MNYAPLFDELKKVIRMIDGLDDNVSKSMGKATIASNIGHAQVLHRYVRIISNRWKMFSGKSGLLTKPYQNPVPVALHDAIERKVAQMQPDVYDEASAEWLEKYYAEIEGSSLRQFYSKAGWDKTQHETIPSLQGI